jgi:SAM-dependent methyltransferase
MVAGEEYLAAMTVLESDRRARVAFQDLVLRTAVPGSCIFDFGAGPGIDAKFYAARGFRVVAYDVDPRMCEAFARLCSDEIASGQISLCRGDYREFIDVHLPTLSLQSDIALVTANFAPLSLVDAPRELFAKLHALPGPGTKFIASVLNPNFIGDLRYGWWWANRLEYWRRGCFGVAGAGRSVYRRSLRNFAALAAPHFTLERVLRGLPDEAAPGAALGPGAATASAAGASAGSEPNATGLQLLTSRYLFLVFAKQ